MERMKREIRRVRYTATKKVAKKAVAVAKSMIFDRLYHSLETKGRRKSLNWRGPAKEKQRI